MTCDAAEMWGQAGHWERGVTGKKCSGPISEGQTAEAYCACSFQFFAAGGELNRDEPVDPMLIEGMREEEEMQASQRH